MPRVKAADPKKMILGRLKVRGAQSASELAAALKISRQAARQHLLGLERSGSVRAVAAGPAKRRSGRPERRYRLTDAAEELFPKSYDALAAELLKTLGRVALRKILSKMADERMRRWKSKLEGKSLDQRLELLKGIYQDEDSYMSVERRDGEIRLIERNCPFYSVARDQPALCSLTVNVLSRALGRRVEREERFQGGHGRCVFRVLPDSAPKPAAGFEFEPESPR